MREEQREARVGRRRYLARRAGDIRRPRRRFDPDYVDEAVREQRDTDEDDHEGDRLEHPQDPVRPRVLRRGTLCALLAHSSPSVPDASSAASFAVSLSETGGTSTTPFDLWRVRRATGGPASFASTGASSAGACGCGSRLRLLALRLLLRFLDGGDARLAKGAELKVEDARERCGPQPEEDRVHGIERSGPSSPRCPRRPRSARCQARSPTAPTTGAAASS